jgi:hypothetical protein
VSSTLRDTSFIYYIWYSLNSSNRSPLLRSPLDAMDEIDEPAIRVPLARDTTEPLTDDGREMTPVDYGPRKEVIDEEEQARRVRRKRDMLQQELEIVAIERQLDVLRRQRNAGHTPVAYSGHEDNSDARSAAGSALSAQVPRKGPASRPCLREPDTFKGKTLKEAQDFIRSLELVFALAPDAYGGEEEKILYGVMFLAGEPRETWYQNHSVSEMDGYLWNDFKSFVFDAVEDPVNRSLCTTVSYEVAKQGEGQSVQAFATELATLEEQMDSYTPAQRTRHLLAKLKPALRTAIITYCEVPKRREDLVSLATRLESAGRRSDNHVVLGSTKRHTGESHANKGKKRRYSPTRGQASRPAPSQPISKGAVGVSRATSGPQCFGCKEYGHIQLECPNRDRWSAKDRAVYKVGA